MTGISFQSVLFMVYYSLISKTILYLQHTPSESARRKLQGVQKYANKHGWSVNIIEDCRRVKDVSRLLDLWKPDGCIADCAGISKAFSPKDFSTIPTVFLNRSAGDKPDRVASVFHNQRQSALLASKEIIRLGRSHFAFIRLFGDTTWSSIRQGVFSKTLSSRIQP